MCAVTKNRNTHDRQQGGLRGGQGMQAYGNDSEPARDRMHTCRPLAARRSALAAGRRASAASVPSALALAHPDLLPVSVASCSIATDGPGASQHVPIIFTAAVQPPLLLAAVQSHEPQAALPKHAFASPPSNPGPRTPPLRLTHQFSTVRPRSTSTSTRRPSIFLPSAALYASFISALCSYSTNA